jgi:WD40 repeat protein
VLNDEERDLVTPFHDGAILSLSTCARRPLVATCGVDRTVRIWNYLNNSVEMMKEFTENVYSVSLHPDGLSILIGFGDKLRFCALFFNDVRPIQEFAVRGCRCCKFSTGGHLFAVVNGSKIQIYLSLTFQLVNTLHRHSAGVHSLMWGDSDCVLASVGNDGAMYIHRLTDSNSRDDSCTTPQVQYFSLAGPPDLASVFVTGSDMKVKEVQNGRVARELAFQSVHSQLVMSNNAQMLFSGTKDGKVYSFGLPIGEDSLSFCCHTGAVTSMAISFDDSLLFTAGEDGVLFTFSVRDRDNRVRTPEKALFSDEVQTTKTEIDEKLNQLRATQAERTDLEMNFRMKKEMIEQGHKTREARIREDAKKAKDKGRILTENRKKEKDEAEMNNNAKERQLIKFWEDRIAAQEDENGKKIIQAHHLCEQTVREKERIENEWQRQIRQKQAEHAQMLEQLNVSHKKRLSSAEAALRVMQDKKQTRIQHTDEMKKQILAEKSSAISTREKRLSEIANENEQRRLLLQDEHLNKVKECSTLQKQFEQQQVESQRLNDEKEKLQGQLKELIQDIARLNEEIKQKDATIVERGVKIENVKRQNQELEKYHQVLNHQENELHNQMDPLDRSIEEETRAINVMDGELQGAHKRTSDQNELIMQMQKELQATIAEERAQTTALTRARTYFEQMKCDLHEVVQHFHAKDELKAVFIAFHNRYMKGEKVEDIQLDENVEAEHARQKVTLESQLGQLRRQYIRNDSFQTTARGSLLRQNASLIDELQALRSQNRTLQTHTAVVMRRPGMNRDLLPATEATRKIEENKRTIARLEGQLTLYTGVQSPRRLASP